VLPSSSGFGETFDVPGDRVKTIGQAISLAEQNSDSSNIIEVATGDYPESTLTISKSVTIRGKDGAKVVIRAASDPLVAIGGVSSSVTLANLILFTAGTAVRIDTAGTVVLRNLVITRASTAIVCPSTGTTSASIDHVTFFQVTNGINCQASSIPIRNNIFSVVSGTPIFPSTVLAATLPNYNLFHAATGPTGERGDNAFPNTTDTADDPTFVDSVNLDFHLQDGSAAIEKGVNVVGDPVDLGAYGGSLTDPVPFPPKNPTVTCGASSCEVKWDQNLDHLVTGYLVLTSAPSAPDPDYERTDPLGNAAAQCTGSPPVCSFTRGSLVDTGTTPAQPSTPTAGFGDTKVQLTWPPVTGATTYDVYFGTSSPPTTLAMTVTPNSALVPNLTNGVLYHFAVGAVNQPKFHAAVQAVYGSTVSATSPASDVSEATPVVYGTAQPGPLSAEVTSTPQPLIDFPPLEDNGGCFIATAAFGSSLAPQVDVLRAFRERYLRPNASGRSVIQMYESWSPPLADAIRSSDTMRLGVRVLLWPLVGLAWMAVYGGPWMVCLFVAVAATTVVWIVVVRRRGAARA
jgi:hypothetical protein